MVLDVVVGQIQDFDGSVLDEMSDHLLGREAAEGALVHPDDLHLGQKEDGFAQSSSVLRGDPVDLRREGFPNS